VSYAWILFRCQDLATAWQLTLQLGTGWSSLAAANAGRMPVNRYVFLELVIVMVIVETLSWLDSQARAAHPLAGRWAPLRAAAYAGLVIGLLEFSAVKTTPFIYLQF
jgi:hypothetical protein